MPLKKAYMLIMLFLFSFNAQAENQLTVFKTETCGCCGGWVEHLDINGFKTESVNLSATDLNEKKQLLGIKPEYQSCHVGVSDQGYIFEGHIPSDLIEQFLKAPPENAIGLAVPGMPVGSPGMEMGDRFQPYQVLLLMKDGSYSVYASINAKPEH